MSPRCCSQCGTNGHNSRTCAESSADVADGGCGSGEIMLFGVRVKVDPMRKCVSMNNLSQYEQPHEASNSGAAADVAAGYASADEAVPHQTNGGRERKRGIPWTEEEHKLFLLGLRKVGKGDWRGISRNFVKTRTPTQVASHAQKYFLRRNNLNRRRRRSSLFDITADSVTALPMEEEQVHKEDDTTQPVMPPQPPRPSPETYNISGYTAAPCPMPIGPVLLPIQIENPMDNPTLRRGDQLSNSSRVIIRPIPVLPMPTASPIADLNLSPILIIEPSPLSLNLSLSSNLNQPPPPPPSRHSAFQVMSSFSNGDSIISVA